MKKHTIRLLTLLLAVCLLAMTAFAAEEWGSLTLTADREEAALGERITLTLSLGDCSQLEGGVKNFKAVVMVPEGLRVVSAEIDPDFAAATGISSPSCNVKEGGRIVISALGNVSGSYTGSGAAIAVIVCEAERDGVFEIALEGGLTDSAFNTRTPALNSVSITSGTGAAETAEETGAAETAKPTEAPEATDPAAGAEETVRSTEAAETIPEAAPAKDVPEAGPFAEAETATAASETRAEGPQNGGSVLPWLIIAVVLCAAAAAAVIILRRRRK